MATPTAVRRADGCVLSWPTAGRSSLSTRCGTTRRTTQGSASSDAARDVGVYASRPFDLFVLPIAGTHDPAVHPAASGPDHRVIMSAALTRAAMKMDRRQRFTSW